ncbi:MAG TPA: DUF3570 domain-containing protein [Polyangiaceae bacterium]|nr:DUF3570 domain-containing protein [Polyangiaceae bacterium]
MRLQLKTRSVLGAGLLLLTAAAAQAQVVDAKVRATLFHEGSATSPLTVVAPGVGLGVNVTEAIRINAGYEADIVTGASESIKGGALSPVDIVSSATSFEDVRHVGSGGFAITRDATSLSATYAYGTESDYRSHSIAVSAGTEFLQRNTELELSYARGFDETCTSAFTDATPPTTRVALDTSTGCFTSDEDHGKRDVNIDTLQAAWTQSWTPVFNTQLVLTGSLQNGFLANPYRSVVIAPNGDQALENHPENRARGAVALRGRYYLRGLRAALGASARIYRDTWDVVGQTYELEAEKYMTSWLRLFVHGRFYTQTGALFWSDDYTGGEPEDGPRGQYWTGDRELSPLNTYLVGGRLLATQEGKPDDRLAGMLLELQSAVSLDLVKTDLKEFTWGGLEPDDTIAVILTLSVGGTF